MVRCKDKQHGYDEIFGPEWCPNAKRVSLGNRKTPFYDDYRCLNWLRQCAITGKIVVHNKKCDAK